ncbi:MAG: DNA ligase [Planctomycetaceae bacterium]|nr:DNA ligase [Planctomycetaceae bacterium]
MPDLNDGESVEVSGSARLPYVVKNVGGVYSCSCPAWRNQSLAIDRRTCKHLIRLRGEQAEADRIAAPVSAPVCEQSRQAPALLLAETWDGEQDVSGWLMSEKLDGVRALWNGKEFLSRNGNTYHAPAWFTAGLPNVPLDGELWLARKSFQRTVSIVRRSDGNQLWRELKFLVFDAPAVNEPFEQRMQFVRECLTEHFVPYAQALAQERCKNTKHLLAELDRLDALGGEGVMLRQPGSRYETGRSGTLLKVKRFHDAEATVIEHLPGTGRHKGRLGALGCMLTNGTTFSVGSGFTDAQRERPPAIGATITFRYQELSDRGVPRFPTFVRVRTDLVANS